MLPLSPDLMVINMTSTIIKAENSKAVILDDHKIFSDAFSMLLEKLNHFKYVHPFYNEKDFLNFVRSYRNESLFLFVDYHLQDHNALSIINTVKKLNKENRISKCRPGVPPHN